MTFTVKAVAKLDSVERMLADFYATPLLHEIHNLTLKARAADAHAERRSCPASRERSWGAPGRRPRGLPGLAGGLRNGAGSSGDLDVLMTVEALLVAGAEKRDELMPKIASKEPIQTLARSTASRPTDKKDEPRYGDMLAKNIFTGIAATTVLTENRDEVLAGVRLTMLTKDRNWQVGIFNQNKPLVDKLPKPKPNDPNPPRLPPSISDNDQNSIILKPNLFVDTFTVTDSYTNEVLSGKVEKVLSTDALIFQRGKMVRNKDGKQVFQGDGRYYRWSKGGFLGDRLASNGDAAAGGASAPRGFPSLDTGDDSGDGGSSDSSSKYIRGALYTPLTPDELKDAGIETSSSSAGN